MRWTHRGAAPALNRFRSSLLLLLTTVPSALARADDGQIEKGGDRFKPNPEVVSSVILQNPIYACADTVVVKGFVPHAELRIFVAGVTGPIGTDPDGLFPDGQPVKVGIHFTANQVVTAVQVVGGHQGAVSNAVTVKNFQQDYPSGLPQPVIDPGRCLDCGAAVGASAVVPGATWTVYAETPMGSAFGPKVKIGSNQDFPYTFVSPQLKAKQRITIDQNLCSSTSPSSEPQIVANDPGSIPATSIDPVFPGADSVVVRSVTGDGAVLDGSTLTVTADYGAPPTKQIGGQPSPGGVQQVFISPHAPSSGTHTFSSSQALCTKGSPGPTTKELTCGDLPAAQIRPPQVGDTQVQVTTFVPGSEILVFATDGGSTHQIAAGGGSNLSLTEPIKSGETLTVVQIVGDCQSHEVFTVAIGCNVFDRDVCSGDWPAYGHSGWRDGQQTALSKLAYPDSVRKLKIMWTFSPPAVDRPIAFKASPIVFQGRVFIGNGNGRLYALDAVTGKLLWEYPKPPAAALTSQYGQVNFANPSSAGIASTASIAITEKQQAVVVFAAPDQSIGAKLGSGRLFALNRANGAEVWKSPEVAILNGLTSSNTNEAVALTQLHENLGYSSPLVLGSHIYVGMADHGDDPIQPGRLMAVDTASGTIDGAFSFVATGTRGGGIWSAAAGGLDKNAIAITTGNSANWNNGSQSEPTPDNALSMLGLNATSGAIDWTLRAVPFVDDNDPDWSAGPSLLDAACGHFAASTEKDGWSYATRTVPVGGKPASLAWQFPPTGIPFAPGDNRHGDTRYIRRGAGWNDTYVTMDGGYDVEASQPYFGFTQLHALDVCAPPSQPVRWVANIPDTTPMSEYQLGPPTITSGVVYVGTSRGHLVVLADPIVYPSANTICSNPEVSTASCVSAGYAIVPEPLQMNDVDLKAGPIQTEPVLAHGRIYVSTDNGKVVMLQP
jgi:outer membrane protein assembly factor BamB